MYENNKCFLVPYHMNSYRDHEGFEYFLKHESHSLMMLEVKSLPLRNDPCFEDMKRCKEAKKPACVCFWYLLNEKKDRPYHKPLKENWKELIDEMYESLTEAGGEYFWGWLWDEPFYYMTGEEYTEVTKYMWEKYGKRNAVIHASVHIHNALWPINESHDFEAVAFRNMPKISPENHAYTTDVAYDYYGEWEHGVHHNTVFRLFLEKLGSHFEKSKFWFTPPIGTVLVPEWTDKPQEEVEQICIDVFMGMWNWAQQYSEHFGGFFMYSYYNWVRKADGKSHANAKAYLCPDENGDIKWKRLYPVLEAVGNGFNEGKLPNEIELPFVEHDKGYIV